MVSNTQLTNLFGSLTQNVTPVNLALGNQLINTVHRDLLEKFFFNETSTTLSTVSQQQFYNLPFDFSLNKTDTITTGNLQWVPTEILTDRDWETVESVVEVSLKKNFSSKSR